MSRDWDNLTGLELRRALAEFETGNLFQGEMYWPSSMPNPVPIPRWDTDYDATMRLLEGVMVDTGHRVEHMRPPVIGLDACVILGGKIGPVYEAHGDTLPEAIARACGKVLEAQGK